MDKYTLKQKTLITLSIIVFLIFLFGSLIITFHKPQNVLGIDTKSIEATIKLDDGNSVEQTVELNKTVDIKKGSLNLITEDYVLNADSPFSFKLSEDTLFINEGSFSITTSDRTNINIFGTYLALSPNTSVSFEESSKIITIDHGVIFDKVLRVEAPTTLKWRVDRFYTIEE